MSSLKFELLCVCFRVAKFCVGFLCLVFQLQLFCHHLSSIYLLLVVSLHTFGCCYVMSIVCCNLVCRCCDVVCNLKGREGCAIVVAMCALARVAEPKMDLSLVFVLLVVAHQTSHTHAFTHTYLGGISFRMRCWINGFVSDTQVLLMHTRRTVRTKSAYCCRL